MKTNGEGKILKALERMTMAHMDSNVLYRCFVDLDAGKSMEEQKEGAKEPEEAFDSQTSPDAQEADASTLPSAEAIVR
jgi:hypothetical protein